MSNRETLIPFDKEHAAVYDQRFAKLAPMKDALHLLIQLVFSELPAAARVLCVGAGTGAELIYLAQVFPQWQFTAVEPAAAMLDICRQRAEACGITARCTFHEGYIDSLPVSDVLTPYTGGESGPLARLTSNDREAVGETLERSVFSEILPPRFLYGRAFLALDT